MNGIRVKGLMCIPPAVGEEGARPYFARMRELFETLGSKSISNVSMEQLSMGMSGDYSCLLYTSEIAVQQLPESAARMAKLRDKLIAGIAERIPEVKLNGHPTLRLPNNVNYSIKYIEGESILLMLDMNGIAASSGSACTSGSLDPSHVLLALGLTHEVAHGSVRLTLSDETTEEDIDYVLDVLPQVAQRLRAMSPLYHE